ncbi:hypothetical protein ASD64_20125 [Mesorhizobium sp. Root157]|uniref:hypothetical protein n=1 Tax=Mesorhizobium sp. Root157 TaxID=1736477 RepID=UPI0007011CF6|nr:hypothetical protein [Mesorhizobium sp. Root157]KQZ84816.1 hypothetical protein ASD64_20125 [Mesorhizobium sp. Root157]
MRDARACPVGARTQREKIETALLFLDDLDDLTVTEPTAASISTLRCCSTVSLKWRRKGPVRCVLLST